MPANSPTTNAVFADRSLLGHPKGLGLLFVTEMWERFSYYGMRALLVLYLVNAQHWTAERAANLYGTYTMLVYLTPLIGGYLADRIIGTRRSLVLGAIVIAAGHFTLAIANETAFYIGLGLIIIGTGFFKSNAAAQVGQIYSEGDVRRDAGFTIYTWVSISARSSVRSSAATSRRTHAGAGTTASQPRASGWCSA